MTRDFFLMLLTNIVKYAAIKSNPPKTFVDGYIFASFDIESLFTNVPLQRTMNINLDRVYNKTLIPI